MWEEWVSQQRSNTFKRPCIPHLVLTWSRLPQQVSVRPGIPGLDKYSLKEEKVRRQCYSLSRVWLFVILWTIARQASLSLGFPRQEYWSGLPFPSPGDLPDQGIEPGSLALQADSVLSEPPGKPSKDRVKSNHHTWLRTLTCSILFICWAPIMCWALIPDAETHPPQFRSQW